MIVLGFITGNSVLHMFFGGLIPGLLIGCALLVTVYIVARISGAPVEPRQPLAEVLRRVRETGWALLLPVIVVGGLRIGLFTVTESSVFAVVYALFVAGVIYRELTWGEIYWAGVRASVTASVVMFIVASATGSAWLLSSEEVPQRLAEAMAGITHSAAVFMALSVVFILLVGMVMDLTPALLILGPIMVPIATQFGIDPIHYSVVMVISLAYGLITPPVGTCLYLCAGIAQVSVTRVIGKTMPMLAAAIAVLILIAAFPPLVTWLPSLMR
jgi:tripartite ATP-independent transporter DctM subunit